MLTYQLQRRVFRLEESAELHFPADVSIKLAFEPQEPFGARHGASRTFKKNAKAKALYNANAGSAVVTPEVGLERVHVEIAYENVKFLFDGHELTVTTRCDTLNSLQQLIISLQSALPALLNLYFYDAPLVSHVSGRIGEVAFRWEFASAQLAFQGATTEQQEQNIASVVDLYTHLCSTNNIRLLAALTYFHRACRLMMAGNGPWEFMAEAILNLTKSLEILFGNSRDQIRAGLTAAGYERDKIEDFFVPIVLLRNHFDVGHGRLAIHKLDDLQLVYALLANAEKEFRDLFQKAALLSQSGKLKIEPYILNPTARYDGAVKDVVDRLRARAGSESKDTSGHSDSLSTPTTPSPPPKAS